METTWDGLPIAPEPPGGASVVVYRRRRGHFEFLLLHRAHHGPDYEGDWAWGPPAGARFPGEHVDTCARRELREETGLAATPEPVSAGPEEWPHYLLEVSVDVAIELSEEHDRFLWCDLQEAARRCSPEKVAESLVLAAREIGGAVG